MAIKRNASKGSKRNRAKGWDWQGLMEAVKANNLEAADLFDPAMADKLGPYVINPDKPLGRAWPDRPYRTMPIFLLRSKIGGTQTSEDVQCFNFALELNARWITTFINATRNEVLPSAMGMELDALPELSDKRYLEAISEFTNCKSVQAHTAMMKEVVRRKAGNGQVVKELEGLLRVRATLSKGHRDASLLQQNISRFIRDSVDNNRAPSEPVLLRSFLPFALSDDAGVSASTIKTALALKRALRKASDVETHEMLRMAFHTRVNPARLYLDYYYCQDIFDLAIYAGQQAVGFREPMDPEMVATYKAMLCKNGVDPEPDPRLRKLRAELAQALRTIWPLVPDLVMTTRKHGDLAST